MTVDADAVKNGVDLLTLIGPDTRLRKVASTRGGEYAGPCPFCGGADRFRVQPERGQWHCRQCSPDDRWQDAIAYVMRRDSVDFREACDRLAGGATMSDQRDSPRVQLIAQTEDTEPSDTWRAAGLELVERAEAALWSDTGQQARGWLNGRGLHDDTLHAWRVGLIAEDERHPAEQWGRDPASHRNGQIFIFRGILLPWFADGQLWQLKIRLPLPINGDKYRAVPGGHPALYGLDFLTHKPAALATEGEFDCMLAWQQAGELVDVFTAGSATKLPAARWLYRLIDARRVFVCMDRDAAGAKGGEKWAGLSQRVRLVDVPQGGDITDCHQAGGDVREWVRSLIKPAALTILGAHPEYPENPGYSAAMPSVSPTRDPRPDLATDSRLWGWTLKLAAAEYGLGAGGPLEALHHVRCCGAELREEGGRLRIVPRFSARVPIKGEHGELLELATDTEWSTEDDWQRTRAEVLAPHRDAITALLRRVGEMAAEDAARKTA